MNERHSQQFLIGLPESGKTTFLAALWHVLFEKDVDGSLQFANLTGDKTYLNNICKEWVGVQRLERTKLGMESTALIQLRDPKTELLTDISIPDLSGESFEQQWTERYAEKGYSEIIDQSEGGLLFIHPDIRESELITNASQLANRIKSPESNVEDNHSNEPIEWDPHKSPTQVQLVELLQFISVLNRRSSIRLAVIISAWDRVHENQSDPDKWLGKRAPLLMQFLQANSEKFECKCFGVSAQGGDIEKNKDELQSIESPSQRIELISTGHKKTNDITLPLRWTIRWD
ncbi:MULTISPECIES: TRAFAC clade GTPase domain-containing protein [Gimesia]|nr:MULTISPECIES: hypothetical protein [Gimesia]